MRTLFVILLLCGVLAGCGHGPPRVETRSGVLEGADVSGVSRFLSIPYAAPPVGERRWREPASAEPWLGVRQATTFGPSCMQNISAQGWGPWTVEFAPHGEVSEDCLTLSVWTPSITRSAHAPVMVWIPGGGFTDGGEATPVYDGAALARRGIVVVSINYRVAAFGLLAHPTLAPEGDGARGNYALRDVFAALHWVRDNIAAFGGDAEQVTIAGQSAGGAMISVLLDAPQARGLFARAIIQSFPPGSGAFADRAAAEQAGAEVAATLGASTAEQMRAAPAARVLAAADHFDLFVDGVLIRDAHGARLPYANDVPILMGVTSDEMSFLDPDLARHNELTARYGAMFARLYPAATDAQARDAVLRHERDAAIVRLRHWADAHGRVSRAPAYLYVWNHALPGPEASRYGAFHSSELVYVFSAFDSAPQRRFSDADRAISTTMGEYWANFVKTGDPNGAGLPAWPRAESDTALIMELGDRFALMPPLPVEVSALHDVQPGEDAF